LHLFKVLVKFMELNPKETADRYEIESIKLGRGSKGSTFEYELTTTTVTYKRRYV